METVLILNSHTLLAILSQSIIVWLCTLPKLTNHNYTTICQRLLFANTTAAK